MAQAGSVTVEVGANLSRFESGMRQVDSRLSRLGSRTTVLGRGFGTLGGGIDRAGRSLGRITRGAASAILSFIGLRGAVLAASGGFLGGAGLIYAMQKAIGVAINLEEQTNKVGVVFGRSSRMILNWSKTTSTGIGLAQTAALEAAGTFGNMLRPLGILPKQAATMSRALVNLAGDMASFNNASLEDTLVAIRAGLAGEVEPLRRFGVFLSETRLKAQAITSGFVPKSFKGVLDPVVKSLSAYNLILKDTALTQGDYKRTADSTANVLRTIKAQVTDLAGAFGKGLEPVLNRVGISLRDKFADPQTKQRVEELGKLVGEKLQNALRKIGDWFRQHWGGIKEGFRTTGRVLRDLAKAAEGFYAVLKKIGSITPGGTSTVIGLIVGGILFSKIMTAANAVTVLNTRLGRLAAMRIVIPIVFATSIYGPMKGWFEKNLGANFSGTQAAGDLIPVKKDGRWVDPNTGRAVRNQRYWDERERRIRSGIGATGPIDGRPGTGLAGERVTSPGGGLKPITSGSFLQAGDAKKKKKKGVQELLPINLRLGLARAELTKQIQDDIRANVEIEKWLEQRVRIERKKERQLDLLEELANTRGRLAALREKDERTRISTLFGGPFLSGDAFSTAASFGYTAKPRDLLKDLRMGNAQLAILARSLRRLQRRGAPKALVEEIRGMGLEGSDEAAALAGASKSTFRQYVRAFKNRERLEERIQHMEVHDMRVATINAGSIVNNARHHGSQPDDTHRRTSTRASRRRGGRI